MKNPMPKLIAGIQIEFFASRAATLPDASTLNIRIVLLSHARLHFVHDLVLQAAIKRAKLFHETEPARPGSMAGRGHQHSICPSRPRSRERHQGQ